jgi:hypothetical protein
VLLLGHYPPKYKAIPDDLYDEIFKLFKQPLNYNCDEHDNWESTNIFHFNESETESKI